VSWAGSATKHEIHAMSNSLPNVRILPMDSQLEFDGRSIDDVQRSFFLKELQGVGRPPGKYWYREAGLDAESGTVVLFQYEGKIIASATLVEVEKFKAAEGATYKGALYFDPKSVRIFDPVGSNLVSAIWPEFKGFSRVKWSLEPKGYPAFEERLTGVESPKQ
jgi:hypothetical protein